MLKGSRLLVGSSPVLIWVVLIWKLLLKSLLAVAVPNLLEELLSREHNN
jgi:hypothetical protein